MSSAIDIRLLGPLEVEHAGARIRLDGIKQRRLFVLLALRAPEAVSSDELLEALWGDEVPASAVHALHKQVSRLRLHLGEGSPLRHRPAGYALEIDPSAIDSRRFERLLDRARAELDRNEPSQAAADLREALALWRSRSGSRLTWHAAATRTWWANWARWSPSTRSASACARS